MAARLDPFDLYDVRSLLGDEERMVQDSVARFVDERVLPIIGDCFDQARFPQELVPEIRRLSNCYHLELRAMEQPSQDPEKMERAFQAAADIGIPIINCGPGRSMTGPERNRCIRRNDGPHLFRSYFMMRPWRPCRSRSSVKTSPSGPR